MQQTPNLNLKKPDGTDAVNIADLNANADILDAEVVKLASATASGRMSAADKTKLDGATSGATASTLVQRDESGRFKAAAPVAADDVVRKAEVDAHASVAASTGAAGHVQLNSTTNSTSTTQAATPSAVKHTYDLANTAKTTADAAMPKAGGTFSGNIAMGAGTGAYLFNNVGIVGTTTSAAHAVILNVDTNNAVVVGSPNLQTYVNSANAPHWWNGAVVRTLIHNGGGQTIEGLTTFAHVALNGHSKVNGAVGYIHGNPGQTNTLEVGAQNSNSDAFMSFHVPGNFAVHFGLDAVDHRLKVGGWSLGTEDYMVWDKRGLRASTVAPPSPQVGDIWIDTST